VLTGAPTSISAGALLTSAPAGSNQTSTMPMNATSGNNTTRPLHLSEAQFLLIPPMHL
jgi:hypothetical protein